MAVGDSVDFCIVDLTFEAAISAPRERNQERI